MKKSEKNLVLFLLATQVFTLNTYTIKKANALDISEKDSTEIAWTADETVNYVLTHLDEVNEMRAEDGFLTAVYSAEVSDIIVDMFAQPTVEGKLIDFDGQKGYLIVGPNKEYYAYSSEYNPPFNDFTSGIHHYDERKGFWYEDDAGNQVILGEPGNTTNSGPAHDQLYAGQKLIGEYSIYDPDAYVLDKYGEEYPLERAYSMYRESYLTGFDYYTMMVYYSELDTHLEQITGPEINGFLAGLSIVDFIGTANKFGDFTTIIKQSYNPQRNESLVYNTKKTMGLSSRTLSNIGGYNSYRKYVTSTYNDDADLTKEQVRDSIVNYFASRNVTIKTEFINGIEVLLKMYLRYFYDKYPFLLYVPTAINSAYTNHFSAICGLREYSKVESIIGSTLMKKTIKVFLEIAESMWYKDTTYFDVYAYADANSYVCAFKF